MSYTSTLHSGSQDSQTQQCKTEIHSHFILQILIFISMLKVVSAKMLVVYFKSEREQL